MRQIKANFVFRIPTETSPAHSLAKVSKRVLSPKWHLIVAALKTSRRVETFKRQKGLFFFLFLSGKLYSNILIAGHLDLALSELRRFISLSLHQVVYDNMYYSIVTPLASYLALSFLILPSQEPSPQNGAWMIWKDRNICNFNSTEQLCHKNLQTCLGICGENGRKRKH